MKNNNPTPPRILRINTVIDCAAGQAGEMAAFYSELLSWDYTHKPANGFSAITSPDGTVFAFQEVDGYERPVWPWQRGEQMQMLHLDIWVEPAELESAVAFALGLGATMASEQYFNSSRTLLDPAGHPFCIDTDGPED